MEKEITTILVTNRLTEVDLNTVTNKTWLSTYGILIWRNFPPHRDINYIWDLSTIDNLMIQLEWLNWEKTDVELPEDVYWGLISYFQNKDRLESDCLSFIIQVLGGDKKSRSINDSNFEYRWWVLLHSVKTLNPWDVILLHTWTEEWLDAWEYHVALYLWDSIFLSKAWE